jgi:hypothetical protein
MQIDKNTIIEYLRQRGDDSSADRADQELPEQVDTDRDAGLLERFGLDPAELMSRFTGGRDLPGI